MSVIELIYIWTGRFGAKCVSNQFKKLSKYTHINKLISNVKAKAKEKSLLNVPTPTYLSEFTRNAIGTKKSIQKF